MGVGAEVGFLVGALVGFLVGALDGALVGTLVGFLVGDLVGSLVGFGFSCDGECDFVGTPVGDWETIGDGRLDGFEVGAVVVHVPMQISTFATVPIEFTVTVAVSPEKSAADVHDPFASKDADK